MLLAVIRFPHKKLKKNILYMASDHAGYDLRSELVRSLSLNNFKIVDLGTHTQESCDYVDYANVLAERMYGEEYSNSRPQEVFGALLCGTGIGMSIAANRYKHIRAALCHSNEYARLAREHNNANIIVLGARFVSIEHCVSMIKTFVSSGFEGGRHTQRVSKL